MKFLILRKFYDRETRMCCLKSIVITSTIMFSLEDHKLYRRTQHQPCDCTPESSTIKEEPRSHYLPSFAEIVEFE